MDLYPIPLAIYTSSFILTLITFKLTIKEITITQYRQIKQKTKININKNKLSINNSINNEKNGNICKCYKFLIRHFTIVQIFICKVSRRVILLMFVHAVIALYLYFMGLSQYWSLALLFNTSISFSIIMMQYWEQKEVVTNKENNITKWKYIKIIYIIMGIITLLIYLFLFKACYKNYQNKFLYQMLVKLGIVFLIDNFASKPFLLLILAYLTHENQIMISLINQYERQEEKYIGKVANEDKMVVNEVINEPSFVDRTQCIIELQIKPYKIDPVKISKRIIHKNLLLTNLNLMDTIDNHQETSVQNIFNYQSKKIQHQNDFQPQQQIQEHPNIQLKKYYCLNLRKQNKKQQMKFFDTDLCKSIEKTYKNDDIFNYQKKQCDKDDKDDINASKSSFRSRGKRYSYYKSKDSLRGVNSMRIIDNTKDNNLETLENIHDKENLNIEIVKDQIIPSYQLHKNNSCTSKGKTQNRRALKIDQSIQNNRDLEEINLQQTPHQRNLNKTLYQTHIIPEQQLRQRNKRQRRKTIRQDVSLPLNDKLIAIYHPQSTKSERNQLFRAIKKNTDRSQFFNRSTRKSHTIGRDKPIVHLQEKQNLVTEFYLPKFNQRS